MGKDDNDQTSLMPVGPKTERVPVVETGVLKVDKGYGTQNPYSVPTAPPQHPAVEIRDEATGGRVILRDGQERERVSIRVKNEGASVRLNDVPGNTFAYLGAIDGTATLAVGGDPSLPGRVLVRGGNYNDRIAIVPSNDGGVLQMMDQGGMAFAYLGDAGGKAELALGGNGHLPGRIVLRNGTYQDQIVLDGASGDILLMNADCAEFFTIDEPAAEPGGVVEPGSVVVLGDEGGALRLCDKEYDQRVVGVVSGAGRYRPGIVLDYQGPSDDRKPVALMGKVVCKVEADSAPITAGCLLTTSAVPGHARAATDRDLAFGAVLGKAMGALASGTGAIPVLVTLQ